MVPFMPPKYRVLFVCTSNAARSQIAEALLRSLRPEYEVFSAGTEPTGVDPKALEVLKNADISAIGLHSKSLEKYRNQHFDYVIALCSKAGHECQTLSNAGEFLVWDFEDPQASGRVGAYARTLEEIRTRLNMFLLVTEKTRA
jgi:Protein-tyrosine-phosphatase